MMMCIHQVGTFIIPSTYILSYFIIIMFYLGVMFILKCLTICLAYTNTSKKRLVNAQDPHPVHVQTSDL